MKAIFACKFYFHVFLLFSLLAYSVGTVFAEPTSATLDTPDPYDWSSFPGEVIFDSPEFILDDNSDEIF